MPRADASTLSQAQPCVNLVLVGSDSGVDARLATRIMHRLLEAQSLTEVSGGNDNVSSVLVFEEDGGGAALDDSTREFIEALEKEYCSSPAPPPPPAGGVDDASAETPDGEAADREGAATSADAAAAPQPTPMDPQLRQALADPADRAGRPPPLVSAGDEDACVTAEFLDDLRRYTALVRRAESVRRGETPFHPEVLQGRAPPPAAAASASAGGGGSSSKKEKAAASRASSVSGKRQSSVSPSGAADPAAAAGDATAKMLAAGQERFLAAALPHTQTLRLSVATAAGVPLLMPSSSTSPSAPASPAVVFLYELAREAALLEGDEAADSAAAMREALWETLSPALASPDVRGLQEVTVVWAVSDPRLLRALQPDDAWARQAAAPAPSPGSTDAGAGGGSPPADSAVDAAAVAMGAVISPALAAAKRAVLRRRALTPRAVLYINDENFNDPLGRSTYGQSPGGSADPARFSTASSGTGRGSTAAAADKRTGSKARPEAQAGRGANKKGGAGGGGHSALLSPEENRAIHYLDLAQLDAVEEALTRCSSFADFIDKYSALEEQMREQRRVIDAFRPAWAQHSAAVDKMTPDLCTAEEDYGGASEGARDDANDKESSSGGGAAATAAPPLAASPTHRLDRLRASAVEMSLLDGLLRLPGTYDLCTARAAATSRKGGKAAGAGAAASPSAAGSKQKHASGSGGGKQDAAAAAAAAEAAAALAAAGEADTVSLREGTHLDLPRPLWAVTSNTVATAAPMEEDEAWVDTMYRSLCPVVARVAAAVTAYARWCAGATVTRFPPSLRRLHSGSGGEDQWGLYGDAGKPGAATRALNTPFVRGLTEADILRGHPELPRVAHWSLPEYERNKTAGGAFTFVTALEGMIAEVAASLSRQAPLKLVRPFDAAQGLASMTNYSATARTLDYKNSTANKNATATTTIMEGPPGQEDGTQQQQQQQQEEMDSRGNGSAGAARKRPSSITGATAGGKRGTLVGAGSSGGSGGVPAAEAPRPSQPDAFFFAGGGDGDASGPKPPKPPLLRHYTTELLLSRGDTNGTNSILPGTAFWRTQTLKERAAEAAAAADGNDGSRPGSSVSGRNRSRSGRSGSQAPGSADRRKPSSARGGGGDEAALPRQSVMGGAQSGTAHSPGQEEEVRFAVPHDHIHDREATRRMLPYPQETQWLVQQYVKRALGAFTFLPTDAYGPAGGAGAAGGGAGLGGATGGGGEDGLLLQCNDRYFQAIDKMRELQPSQQLGRAALRETEMTIQECLDKEMERVLDPSYEDTDADDRLAQAGAGGAATSAAVTGKTTRAGLPASAAGGAVSRPHSSEDYNKTRFSDTAAGTATASALGMTPLRGVAQVMAFDLTQTMDANYYKFFSAAANARALSPGADVLEIQNSNSRYNNNNNNNNNDAAGGDSAERAKKPQVAEAAAIAGATVKEVPVRRLPRGGPAEATPIIWQALPLDILTNCVIFREGGNDEVESSVERSLTRREREHILQQVVLMYVAHHTGMLPETNGCDWADREALGSQLLHLSTLGGDLEEVVTKSVAYNRMRDYVNRFGTHNASVVLLPLVGADGEADPGSPGRSSGSPAGAHSPDGNQSLGGGSSRGTSSEAQRVPPRDAPLQLTSRFSLAAENIFPQRRATHLWVAGVPVPPQRAKAAVWVHPVLGKLSLEQFLFYTNEMARCEAEERQRLQQRWEEQHRGGGASGGGGHQAPRAGANGARGSVANSASSAGQKTRRASKAAADEEAQAQRRQRQEQLAAEQLSSGLTASVVRQILAQHLQQRSIHMPAPGDDDDYYPPQPTADSADAAATADAGESGRGTVPLPFGNNVRNSHRTSVREAAVLAALPASLMATSPEDLPRMAAEGRKTLYPYCDAIVEVTSTLCSRSCSYIKSHEVTATLHYQVPPPPTSRGGAAVASGAKGSGPAASADQRLPFSSDEARHFSVRFDDNLLLTCVLHAGLSDAERREQVQRARSASRRHSAMNSAASGGESEKGSAGNASAVTVTDGPKPRAGSAKGQKSAAGSGAPPGAKRKASTDKKKGGSSAAGAAGAANDAATTGAAAPTFSEEESAVLTRMNMVRENAQLPPPISANGTVRLWSARVAAAVTGGSAGGDPTATTAAGHKPPAAPLGPRGSTTAGGTGVNKRSSNAPALAPASPSATDGSGTSGRRIPRVNLHVTSSNFVFSSEEGRDQLSFSFLEPALQSSPPEMIYAVHDNAGAASPLRASGEREYRRTVEEKTGVVTRLFVSGSSQLLFPDGAVLFRYVAAPPAHAEAAVHETLTVSTGSRYYRCVTSEATAPAFVRLEAPPLQQRISYDTALNCHMTSREDGLCLVYYYAKTTDHSTVSGGVFGASSSSARGGGAGGSSSSSRRQVPLTSSQKGSSLALNTIRRRVNAEAAALEEEETTAAGGGCGGAGSDGAMGLDVEADGRRLPAVYARVALHGDGTSITTILSDTLGALTWVAPTIATLLQDTKKIGADCNGDVRWCVESPRMPRVFLGQSDYESHFWAAAAQEKRFVAPNVCNCFYVAFGDGSVLKRQVITRPARGESHVPFLESVLSRPNGTTVRVIHENAVAVIEPVDIMARNVKNAALMAIGEGFPMFDLAQGGMRLIDFNSHICEVADLFSPHEVRASLSPEPVALEALLQMLVRPVYSPHRLPKREKEEREARQAAEEQRARQLRLSHVCPPFLIRLRELAEPYITDNNLLRPDVVNTLTKQRDRDRAPPQPPRPDDAVSAAAQLMMMMMTGGDGNGNGSGGEAAQSPAHAQRRVGHPHAEYLTAVSPLNFAQMRSGEIVQHFRERDLKYILYALDGVRGPLYLSRSTASGEPGVQQLSLFRLTNYASPGNTDGHPRLGGGASLRGGVGRFGGGGRDGGSATRRDVSGRPSSTGSKTNRLRGGPAAALTEAARESLVGRQRAVQDRTTLFYSGTTAAAHYVHASASGGGGGGAAAHYYDSSTVSPNAVFQGGCRWLPPALQPPRRFLQGRAARNGGGGVGGAAAAADGAQQQQQQQPPVFFQSHRNIIELQPGETEAAAVRRRVDELGSGAAGSESVRVFHQYEETTPAVKNIILNSEIKLYREALDLGKYHHVMADTFPGVPAEKMEEQLRLQEIYYEMRRKRKLQRQKEKAPSANDTPSPQV